MNDWAKSHPRPAHTLGDCELGEEVSHCTLSFCEHYYSWVTVCISTLTRLEGRKTEEERKETTGSQGMRHSGPGPMMLLVSLCHEFFWFLKGQGCCWKEWRRGSPLSEKDRDGRLPVGSDDASS